jgi:hypothetical protein
MLQTRTYHNGAEKFDSYVAAKKFGLEKYGDRFRGVKERVWSDGKVSFYPFYETQVQSTPLAEVRV